jgi:5S rRNA maturation endonuclease (ribonuclease M5)
MKQDPRSSRARRTYNIDALEDVIDALLDASAGGALVIVEGIRDRDSLRKLGISGPVVMASRRSCLDLAEDAARNFREIVVLTDWDEKGDEMAKNIEHCLRCAGAGTHVDLDIRSKLSKLVRKEIKDVESLSIYVERVRELYGL